MTPTTPNDGSETSALGSLNWTHPQASALMGLMVGASGDEWMLNHQRKAGETNVFGRFELLMLCSFGSKLQMKHDKL